VVQRHRFLLLDRRSRALKRKFPTVYTWSDGGAISGNDAKGPTKMPGPRPQPIVLTESQREMLVHLTRRTSSTQGLVRRVRIVLAAAEGLNNEQIAQRLGINRETARLWRSKWLAGAQRLVSAEEEEERKKLRECIEEDVLADAPRSGAPATFTPEQVVRIVALACEDPREGSGWPVTHWTAAELADEAKKRGIVRSISPRSVGRFLGRGGPGAPSDSLLAQQRAGQRAGGLRRGG
jgi:transposase